MDRRTVIYYTDELNEEFSRAQITPRRIDGSYVYVHRSFWKAVTHFFWYRLVATPAAFLYTKLVFQHRVCNREVLKPYRKQGYFFYGNHTQDIGDALMPHMMNFPKDNVTIVHPNNVSMPYLGKINPSLGALPLPDDREAYRHFMNALEHFLHRGRAVVIYPEAHIWPFYTGIRPFGDASFQYPVKWEMPVFCFTNTYQKRRFSKKPRIVTYIDGPFFPNSALPIRERRQALRDEVYACMCERAKASEVTWIQYIKKDGKDG